MASIYKDRIKSLPIFRIEGSRVRRFEIVRPDYPPGEVAPYGRLEPATATTKKWPEPLPVLDALIEWFRVRTLFREWEYLRERRIWLDEVRTKSPRIYAELTTKERRVAAGRQAARTRFDDALKACAGTYGPLGGRVWHRDDDGNRTEWKLDRIEEMMDAIDDLRIWLSPGIIAHSMHELRDERLIRKHASIEDSIERVDRAISYGGYTRGSIEKPNLYSALAAALHYSRVAGIEYRLCGAPKCGALFVAKRPDNYLCSRPACRKRVSARKQRRKRA